VLDEKGDMERALSEPCAISAARCAGLDNMAECICALIAELLGIGCAAATKAIKNEKDRAPHQLLTTPV
jgi:hypothetical protein